MRICVIGISIPPVPGGLEVHTWELARHLAKAGHSVELIAWQPQASDAMPRAGEIASGFPRDYERDALSGRGGFVVFVREAPDLGRRDFFPVRKPFGLTEIAGLLNIGDEALDCLVIVYSHPSSHTLFAGRHGQQHRTAGFQRVSQLADGDLVAALEGRISIRAQAHVFDRGNRNRHVKGFRLRLPFQDVGLNESEVLVGERVWLKIQPRDGVAERAQLYRLQRCGASEIEYVQRVAWNLLKHKRGFDDSLGENRSATSAE